MSRRFFRRLALLSACVVVVLALGSWLLVREGPSHGAFAAASVHASASADLRAPPAAGPSRFADPPDSLASRTMHAEAGVDLDRRVAGVSDQAVASAASARRLTNRTLASTTLLRPADPTEDLEPSNKPLTDRTDGREQLVAAIQADFMPLADECIEQAKRRRPELTGDLVFGIETVADDKNGGVIETVEWQPDNQIDDPELLECIEESALTMNLPADDYGDPFELHLKID